MISKELLSEVLNKTITYMSDELDGDLIPYQTANIDGWATVNQYELAHKCKEWAIKYCDFIQSGRTKDIYGYCSFTFDLCNDEPKIFESETEPEAIFKACDYILKEKGRKQNDRHD